MKWVYCADGGAKIHGRFEPPQNVFHELPMPSDILLNLPAFGTRHLCRDIAYCIMPLKCGFQDDAANRFGIGPDIPMQGREEVAYDVEDRAVGLCKYHPHPADIVMSILTKFF